MNKYNIGWWGEDGLEIRGESGLHIIDFDLSGIDTDAEKAEQLKRIERMVESANTGLDDLIYLHAMLYPEQWPREMQPDHIYWDGVPSDDEIEDEAKERSTCAECLARTYRGEECVCEGEGDYEDYETVKAELISESRPECFEWDAETIEWVGSYLNRRLKALGELPQ